ncbi:TlyA family RNA methyltransferase [Hyphomicrobium sp. 802]|uniref:TlyA family RNA methyltransferase n=1 Tax=Hyphomicrobium sp. 802 TaxID=1112272 RepID=UPI00045E5B12|nr:TlyA family RNA methyltransferase [Hyphomicrobium sp. 802]
MRLDQMLVARGLAPSRARAQDLIKRGFVSVGGAVCNKPAFDVKSDSAIAVASDAPGYVSRGAEKLSAALARFGFDPTGRVALDIGASTGGFTEVLLEQGARRVYAVDVGTSQLHARLKDDPRVVSLENIDARALTPNEITESVSAVVVDVSFISVTKVLGTVLRFASRGAWAVILVKPQFEVGRDNVGSGGIVRDEAARLGVLASVREWLAAQPGWTVVGDMPSPILGGSGNAEFLLGARYDG